MVKKRKIFILTILWNLSWYWQSMLKYQYQEIIDKLLSKLFWLHFSPCINFYLVSCVNLRFSDSFLPALHQPWDRTWCGFWQSWPSLSPSWRSPVSLWHTCHVEWPPVPVGREVFQCHYIVASCWWKLWADCHLIKSIKQPPKTIQSPTYLEIQNTTNSYIIAD